MAKFTTLTSRVAVLAVDDVDTDQIIPARYLKATDKEGMGACLFADWRYKAGGDQQGPGEPDPDFVLNRPEAEGAQILLAGDNFGCGSSREHAAWALAGYGFRAVVATSFADIFRNNALKNGLLPVAVDPETHQELCALLAAAPQAELSIDLAAQTLTSPDGRAIPFPIDGFAKDCLLRGVDELGYLLSFAEQISEYEAREESEYGHPDLRYHPA